MLKGECPECHAFRERYFFASQCPSYRVLKHLDEGGVGEKRRLWTNNKYRMIYLNMGHGDDCFSDAAQKQLFTNAFRWVVSKSPKGNPFEK